MAAKNQKKVKLPLHFGPSVLIIVIGVFFGMVVLRLIMENILTL